MLPIRPVPAPGAASARPAERPAGGPFRLAPGAQGRPEALSAAPPAALSAGLLALQAEEGPAERNRRAWKRGRALLDQLQGLHADLLGGGIDESRLQRIAGLCQGEPGDDPGLRDAVESLALRARLELARLGVAPDVSPGSSVGSSVAPPAGHSPADPPEQSPAHRLQPN